VHDRLKLALELVREAVHDAADDASGGPEPLTLSTEKRQALLAHFQQPAPQPAKTVAVSFWQGPRREWLQLAAMIVGLLATLWMFGNHLIRQEFERRAESGELVLYSPRGAMQAKGDILLGRNVEMASAASAPAKDVMFEAGAVDGFARKPVSSEERKYPARSLRLSEQAAEGAQVAGRRSGGVALPSTDSEVQLGYRSDTTGYATLPAEQAWFDSGVDTRRSLGAIAVPQVNESRERLSEQLAHEEAGKQGAGGGGATRGAVMLGDSLSTQTGGGMQGGDAAKDHFLFGVPRDDAGAVKQDRFYANGAMDFSDALPVPAQQGVNGITRFSRPGSGAAMEEERRQLYRKKADDFGTSMAAGERLEAWKRATEEYKTAEQAATGRTSGVAGNAELYSLMIQPEAPPAAGRELAFNGRMTSELSVDARAKSESAPAPAPQAQPQPASPAFVAGAAVQTMDEAGAAVSNFRFTLPQTADKSGVERLGRAGQAAAEFDAGGNQWGFQTQESLGLNKAKEQAGVTRFDADFEGESKALADLEAKGVPAARRPAIALPGLAAADRESADLRDGTVRHEVQLAQQNEPRSRLRRESEVASREERLKEEYAKATQSPAPAAATTAGTKSLEMSKEQLQAVEQQVQLGVKVAGVEELSDQVTKLDAVRPKKSISINSPDDFVSNRLKQAAEAERKGEKELAQAMREEVEIFRRGLGETAAEPVASNLFAGRNAFITLPGLESQDEESVERGRVTTTSGRQSGQELDSRSRLRRESEALAAVPMRQLRDEVEPVEQPLEERKLSQRIQEVAEQLGDRTEEALRRQETEVVLGQTLARAKELEAKGELANARTLSEEAKKLSEMLKTADLPANMVQSASATSAEANLTTTIPLPRSRLLPTEPEARNRERVEALDKAPGRADSGRDASTLTHDAKLLYEMRRLDEAEAKLREAVKADPANQSAYYYLAKIQEDKYANETGQRDGMQRRRVSAVEKAWQAEGKSAIRNPQSALDQSLLTSAATNSAGEIELLRKRVDGEAAKETRPLVTRTFKVDHKTFTEGLGSVVAFPFVTADGKKGGTSGGQAGGGGIAGSGSVTNSASVPEMVLQFFIAAGVNLNTNGHANTPPVIYDDRSGTLTVRATPQDMENVLQAIELLSLKEDEPPPPPKQPAAPAPVPQPEVSAAQNAFSTFSLNVSDVSFKLAAASLEKGVLPEAASIRTEEFINAFNYHDPEPTGGAPVAFAWERARYPFAHDRDLVRFSVKTAASGRQAGRPLNLVLLLDNSGSMERADRVAIRAQCLRVLAAQLQPQDRLSVVSFARTARLWVDGAAGNQAGDLAARVGTLTPEGGTNLEDALNLAYRTALRHFLPQGVNRVVLLTDGAANLGDVVPESLKKKVEAHRKQGVAFDCFGIGWEGYNDDLLEVLSRNGDGRYGFVNTPVAAGTEFAGQLAGALQVAASDVKVQVEWNPRRVTTWRQIGYAKHQLKKEQFRDNTVDAAEIAAAEAGNALYTVQVNPRGEGPIGVVRVRFRVPGTNDYREHEWPVPYDGQSRALADASPAMRLAAVSSAFSEMLASSPFAGEVTPDALLGLLAGVPEQYPADPRPKQLEWMLRQAQSLGVR
jgi:tetratricopeptide (TPR) repeat protein